MIQIIKDKEELSKIRDEWDNLANKMKTPVLMFDWVFSIVTTIHRNDQLRIFVLRENDKLTAIAPLFIDQSGMFEQLSILGVATLYEPVNLLYDTKYALEKLLSEVCIYGLPITLLRIPDQGDVQTILSKFNIKRGIKLSTTSSSSSFIELTDYRHFNDADLKEKFCINTMSSSRRATLRRKRKCLEKQGNVVFKWVDLTQDNFDDIFTEILRIEDASWKGDVNSSLLKNKMLSNFFYKYAKTQVIDGNLRVCLLCVDDQAVSMHLAVQKFQTLWILKLGHMSEYNKCSPGIQTTMETIFYSLDNDLNRYEFMGSEEKWQEIWPVKSHSLSTCLFFPYTFYAVFSLIKLVIIQLKNKVIH